MKNLIITLIISVAASFAINAQNCELKRYELDVKDFTHLKVVHGINVTYINNPDSAGRAIFIAPDSCVSMFMFNNTKNLLEIQLNSDNKKINNIPSITVFSKFLTNVENSGDSTVTIQYLASCPKLKARLIGNGKIIANEIDINEISGSISTGNGTLTLSGNCKSANLNNTGTGTIQAENLFADIVKCKMLGTGSTFCNAKNELSISGMSSGKVYYRGNPSEVKKRSVGVKIIPLDNEE